jgi:hypothetical protein
MLKILKKFTPLKFKTFIKKLRKFNAYHDLDKQLLEYINYKKGFYIDCGANDGVNQSTTWFFEKYLNWRGILIEPIPDVYNQLIKNRSKKNFFYNYALVNSEYTKDEIDFIYNKNDSLLAKKSPKSFSKNILNYKDDEIIKVKATTLNKIIFDHKLPQIIDLFSLDVEGYEFEVLKGINFNEIKFKYIIVETNSPKEMDYFLEKKGYTLVKRLSNYNSAKDPGYGDYLYRYNH